MKMSNSERTAGADGSELVGEFVRIYCRGQVWWANYQAGKKQHRKSLKTTKKKVALHKALKIESELAAGTWRPATEPASIEKAIGDYRSYLGSEGRAPKTLTKYEKLFERVSALAEDRKVRDLSGIDLAFVDAFRQMRNDAKAKPKTIYNETTILRQLINFALSRRLIETDPLRGLKIKKPKPTKQPCWTHDEVQKILAASPAGIQAALTILAETGMRFGELAWLTWEDIDWERNVLHIQPKDGWRLKTGDQRKVPLSAVATAVLKSLPQRWRWVVTMPVTKQSPTPGCQWTERRLLDALKKVLKTLRLPGKIHTFRHFFISNALLNGTPEVVVKKWVGHVDQRIIEMYSHVHDEADQAAMQRLVQANRKLQKTQEVSRGPDPVQT
jgi:integrase